jgi:hypothetical protein
MSGLWVAGEKRTLRPYTHRREFRCLPSRALLIRRPSHFNLAVERTALGSPSVESDTELRVPHLATPFTTSQN